MADSLIPWFFELVNVPCCVFHTKRQITPSTGSPGGECDPFVLIRFGGVRKDAVRPQQDRAALGLLTLERGFYGVEHGFYA